MCLPCTSVRSMLNPGPTVPTSCGRSADEPGAAANARPATTSARRLRIGRQRRPRRGRSQLIRPGRHRLRARLDAGRRCAEGGPIPLRFELSDDGEPSLAFGYSPLLETVLSLHVLVEPKHHALQHEWVRSMRRLPPALRREITALQFLYRWTMPNCVLPAATTAYDDFATELAQLRSLRTEVAAFELLRTLYDHGGARRPARRKILADREVRAVVLRRARRIGASTQRAAALLFDDPRELVARFTGLLEAYWETAFAEEWRRIEPDLAAAVVAAGREIAGGGMHRFLLGLAPQLRVEH